jgi:hypothetical protein
MLVSSGTANFYMYHEESFPSASDMEFSQNNTVKPLVLPEALVLSYWEFV